MISKIMTQTQNWLPTSEFPVMAGLKPIKANDPNYGLHEDEIQDRYEFIKRYLQSEYESILSIPKPEKKDFFAFNLLNEGAFGSQDFQRLLKSFNKYHYVMEKIMGRIKDLAIIYSVIHLPEDKTEIYNKYQRIMDNEFRIRLSYLQKKSGDGMNPQSQINSRIFELNRRILEGEKTWKQYSAPEAE